MTFASVIFVERPCYLEKTFSRYQADKKNHKYFSTVEKSTASAISHPLIMAVSFQTNCLCKSIALEEV